MPLAAYTAWLDYAGVAGFAVGSAIVPRRRQFDFTATLLIACAAALGGGTLRDLLIQQPVFWVVDPGYVVVCLIAAACVWFAGVGSITVGIVTMVESVGIGCFAVVGAAKALNAGTSPIVSVIMGALTATFGGIVSETLAGRNTVLTRREIYVTAALASATIYYLLLSVGVVRWVAASLSATTGMVLRLATLFFGWRMPVPRSRR